MQSTVQRMHPATWICVLALTERGRACRAGCTWAEYTGKLRNFLHRSSGMALSFSHSILRTSSWISLSWCGIWKPEILKQVHQQEHSCIWLLLWGTAHLCQIQVWFLGTGLEQSISLPNPWVCFALNSFSVAHFWALSLSSTKRIKMEAWIEGFPLTSWICCRCSTTGQVLSINWLQICVGGRNTRAAGVLWVGCPAALRGMGLSLRRVGGGGSPAECFWWRCWMQKTNRYQLNTYRPIFQKITTIPKTLCISVLRLYKYNLQHPQQHSYSITNMQQLNPCLALLPSSTTQLPALDPMLLATVCFPVVQVLQKPWLFRAGRFHVSATADKIWISVLCNTVEFL